MAKDFSTMDNSNPSPTPSIHDLSSPQRRTVLRGGLAATISGLLAPLGVASLAGCSTTTAGRQSALGFKAVAMNDLDAVTVPDGYRVQVLFMGDAAGIAGNMPAYKPDASNTATEQEVQAWVCITMAWRCLAPDSRVAFSHTRHIGKGRHAFNRYSSVRGCLVPFERVHATAEKSPQ